tara:strand:+ start:669 stop:1094 length:426 start_codon:yes stop_codon:yes gene_type:complete
MVDEAQRQRTIFPDARESYIRETHEFNSPTNVINRELQRYNDLQKAYEGHTVPQRFPDWVTRNPNASEMINNWTMPGGGSWMGSPMWMDAKNKTYGLPGTEVAQSKWKENFRSIIDMIMNREGLDERDAKKYIFDNYGLAV